MGKTLSFGKGKGNIRHNNRDYLTENVDKDRVQDNVYLVRQSLEDAYKECFGQAIEDYNATQKRSDRKKSIPAYMDEIKRNQANRNGEKLFYEQVIGIGDMHDSGIITHPEDAQTCKAILLDYFKEWQERNPNLHVFNAVLHMDEQTPHLHVDYIPVGYGYKQGVQARNSLTKAFECMGVESAKSKDDNATIKWQARERGRITEIAKEHGVEIDVIGIKRDDYTISDYKALVRDEKQALKQIQAEKPKRINLPFGMALETNRADVDTALQRKADVKKHAETYKQATKEAESVTEHATEGVKAIKGIELSLEHERAELERLKRSVEQEKAKALADLQAEKDKYTRAYHQQKDLNETYNQLCTVYQSQKQTIADLQTENRSLRMQVANLKDSIKQQIEQAIAPLKEKLEQVAKGHYATMKVIAWCTKHLNLGEVSKDVLESAWANARDYMKEDGFPDYTEKAAQLPQHVKNYMELDLEFKQLNGVKGVYTSKGTLIEPCTSLAKAKEMFPSCNIANKVISHDLVR